MKTEAFTTARASNTRLANNLFVSNLLQIGIVLLGLSVLVHGQTTCGSNCQSCNAVGKCSVCNPGYYMSIPGACSKCKSNCATCDSSTTCFSCLPGAYMTTFGICNRCSTGCSSCTNSSMSSCSACIDGYAQSTSGGCSKCGSNCKTCSSTSSIGCTSCQENYELTDGQCTSPSFSNSVRGLAVAVFLGCVIFCFIVLPISICFCKKKQANTNTIATPSSLSAQSNVPMQMGGLRPSNNSLAGPTYQFNQPLPAGSVSGRSLMQPLPSGFAPIYPNSQVPMMNLPQQYNYPNQSQIAYQGPPPMMTIQVEPRDKGLQYPLPPGFAKA
jgi:hypothetical protein